MLNTYRLPIVALLLLLPCLAWTDTTITYQGQLRDASGPVNGTPGMEFRLFDSLENGSQVGSAIVLSAVPVSDGLFQVELDFGEAYSGDPRYLEVMVSGQTLTPRQRITPAPMAAHALKVSGTTLADLGCASGQVAKWNGSSWSCAADDHTEYSAGSGLTLSGTTLSLDTTITDHLYWRQGGNAGTSPGSDFLGTTDAVPFELHVEGNRALRIEPTTGSPNMIGGNRLNSIDAGVIGATIGGGGSNTRENRISGDGDFTTVSGGIGNEAKKAATIGGGVDNTADGGNSTIAGGTLNRAFADEAAIGGGKFNEVNGSSATIGGGSTNEASGEYATVPGGQANTAAGNYSFAAGRAAKANHRGTFVWADSYSSNFNSSDSNQFIIRASGGVGINTNNPWTPLHIISEAGQAPFRVMVGDNNVDSAAIRAYGHQGVAIGRSWGDTAVPARGLRVFGQVRIGDLAAGGSDVCITTDGTLSQCSSSARYKDNITPLESARELLGQLRAVKYEWIESGRPDIGLIAEEVAEVIPEIVTHNREGEIQGIEYSRLSALLIAAFQEQEEEYASRFAAIAAKSNRFQQRVTEQNAELQEKVAALSRERSRVSELENRLAALESLLLENNRVAEKTQ